MRLYHTMTERGFTVTHQQHGGMGGAVIVLDGAVSDNGDPVPVQVRLSGELGEWTVEFKLAGMADFQGSWVWLYHLDGEELGPTSIERQAEFVADRLPDVARALRADPGLEQKLSQLGQNYMRRQLGLPPLEDEG